MRPFTLNLFIAVLFLAVLPLAQAQYKYTEPGKGITYSDLPPPGNATVLKLNNAPVSESRNSNLPYELKQAVSNFPVVLYTAPSCAACDEGRNFLRNRGIPYSEKTVKTNEDFDVLKQNSPQGTVPLLLVGKRKTVGFSSPSWGDVLTDAGYPATSKLPRDYQFGEAESAAPTVTAVKPGSPSSPGSTATSPPQASGTSNNAPPGFRF